MYVRRPGKIKRQVQYHCEVGTIFYNIENTLQYVRTLGLIMIIVSLRISRKKYAIIVILRQTKF
jgi:hypothetical protein